ncbi:MAG: MFS transporter, partial [Candidatus Cloacimonetes bacterium]|nr:MFS transporter [Candidatus Cloacimonadota bacterium]
NFRRYLIYGIWWMTAIGIGSAFWGPFMLQKLKMSLFEMQIYGSISTLSTLFAYNFWGRFIDKNGNKTAMKICIFLGGLNPMFWLFMRAGNYSIIWFEALLSGFMWSGAGIVSTNFVLSIAPQGREQVYAGIYGAIGGIGMMSTTLLCGILYPDSILFHGVRLEPEQIIFGIGGLARWTAIIPLLFVKESRAIPLRRIIFYSFSFIKLKISQLSNWLNQGQK